MVWHLLTWKALMLQLVTYELIMSCDFNLEKLRIKC